MDIQGPSFRLDDFFHNGESESYSFGCFLPFFPIEPFSDPREVLGSDSYSRIPDPYLALIDDDVDMSPIGIDDRILQQIADNLFKETPIRMQYEACSHKEFALQALFLR